ncbi:MAG: transposase, partial [Acidiferrobacteraceae bacterium]
GISSLLIRRKNYPGIKKKLWGGALWSPSYFAGSCGGAPLAVIRKYIEQQQTPHQASRQGRRCRPSYPSPP